MRKNFFVMVLTVCTMGMVSLHTAQMQSPEGIWQGVLDAQGSKLRIVFKIAKTAEGGWKTTMDSPDQMATGIPVDRTDVRGDSVILVVRSAVGMYQGKMEADMKTIKGNWKQAGMVFPLSLARTESAPDVRRPKEPKPPFPYLSEDVTFKNVEAGIVLAGTFTSPKQDGAFPAVILLSGSGPQDRDEFVFGHRPFLVLADALTRRGMAVLRFDDRGVGKSTGNFAIATLEDFASDAVAALEYLATRKNVDLKRIGIIGHSEGAAAASIVAAGRKDVAFAVLLAGSGMKGEDLVLLQMKAIAKAQGADSNTIEANTRVEKTLFAVLKDEKDPVMAENKLREIMTGMMNASMIDSQVKQLMSPGYRFFLEHDPLPALEKMKCPVLALWGQKDLQVPPAENKPLVENALKKGGHTKITVDILPGLNHLFQPCKTGSPSEYATIEETFSPDALTLIGNWVVKQH